MHSTDLFSHHAEDYKRFRPTYPEDLFSWLADQTPTCDKVWDCGTGNGQGAMGLAEHFNHVVATDLSSTQIQETSKHPRIQYRVATADDSGLENQSVSLVTVFQALHWFANNSFFNEAKRVLKPGGLLAVIGYNTALTGIQVVDDTYKELYFHYLFETECWAEERRLLNNNYDDINFPFVKKVTAPQCKIHMRWNYDDYLSYINTCSAVKKHIERYGANPVESFVIPRIEASWPNKDEKRDVFFPLVIQCGPVG